MGREEGVGGDEGGRGVEALGFSSLGHVHFLSLQLCPVLSAQSLCDVMG